MRRPGVIITGLLAIALIVGVVLAVGNKSNKNNNNAATPAASSSNAAAPESNTPQAAATITYDGGRFNPSTLTVNSGDTVAIKNTSSNPLQMNSNPHPVHSDDIDLNVGSVDAGQSVTFTLTKKGTFGYHNHLDPSQTATITIK